MSQQELRKVQSPIAIPEPTNQVDALWRTCMALKEAVEVLQGLRGNRAAALKVELNDLGDTINAGGPGIDTFFELLDTNLTTQAVNHLVYNADGTNWWNTGDNFRWFPTSGVDANADSSVRYGFDTTVDFSGDPIAETPDITAIKYTGAGLEVGPETWFGGSLSGSEGHHVKGSAVYIDVFSTTSFNEVARFTNAITNELTTLELKDRDDTYRPAGFGAMKTVTAAAPTDTILQTWFHSRVYCTAATTLSLDDISLGSMPDGSVMWIQADGGDVTVQPINSAILRKFLGTATTTGSATIADGGWATLVKIGGFASDDFHITGVGVT